MKLTLAALLVFIGLLQFQNCSWVMNNESNSSSNQKMDGGNGYDGKRSQYVRWDGTGICPDRILESILVENAGTASQVAFLTRKDCVDIAPTPIDLGAAGFLAYNSENIVHGTAAYDLSDSPSVLQQEETTILCRGEVDKKKRGMKVVADVRISISRGNETLSLSSPQYIGKTFLGVYDLADGALIEKNQSDGVVLLKDRGDACPKDGCLPEYEYFMNSSSENGIWRLQVPVSPGELGNVKVFMMNGENIAARIPCFRQ